MRGPDRGSDYRRRQLVETMRGHTLTGRAIARRLRTRARVADGLPSLRRDDGTADRPLPVAHQLAGD
jgi:hypothetical protein